MRGNAAEQVEARSGGHGGGAMGEWGEVKGEAGFGGVRWHRGLQPDTGAGSCKAKGPPQEWSCRGRVGGKMGAEDGRREGCSWEKSYY